MCPNGTCFFYDQNSGLLFINMVQEQPNAGGPYTSPLGACIGQQSVERSGLCQRELLFMSRPRMRTVHDSGSHRQLYSHGQPSACTPYGGAGGATDYTQAYPSNLNQLAYASNGVVVQTQLENAGTFPHQAPTNEPADLCPTKKPAKPDWSPAPPAAVPAIFTIGIPANPKGPWPRYL